MRTAMRSTAPLPRKTRRATPETWGVPFCPDKLSRMGGEMSIRIRRRELIAALGRGATWPLPAHPYVNAGNRCNFIRKGLTKTSSGAA